MKRPWSGPIGPRWAIGAECTEVAERKRHVPRPSHPGMPVCCLWSLCPVTFLTDPYKVATLFGWVATPFRRHWHPRCMRLEFSMENPKPTLNDSPGPTQVGLGPDWHPADVLAALKKRGRSLAGISVANGYHPTAAGKALRGSWPAMEAVIAAAIGIAPCQIWPSRYDDAGLPIKPARSRSATAIQS